MLIYYLCVLTDIVYYIEIKYNYAIATTKKADDDSRLDSIIDSLDDE